MPSWLVWTLLAAALLAFVVVVIVAWRVFTLLRTPGSFKARLVTDQDTNQPGRPVVVSYNEYSVEIFSVYSIWPRPRVTVPRHRLEVTRLPRRTRLRSWLQLDDIQGEIGRASCRERVRRRGVDGGREKRYNQA